MMALTDNAKKTFLSLVIGNLLLIFSVIGLLQYLDYVNRKPMLAPSVVHSLVQYVHQFKDTPTSKWAMLLKKYPSPWSTITYTETPAYPDNALLNLRSMNVYDALKHQKKVEVSVFIKEGVWLNITLIPPMPSFWGVWIMIASFLLLLLGILLLIHYLAVRNLNQPILTLSHSLQYAEEQGEWLPLPEIGNADQKKIFHQINLLQEKVRQLLQNRMRVLSAISHDLRTPLTRLKLRTEYLEGNPHFEKMMQDIQDMEGMIRDTLDYFKENYQEEVMQRFDLVALVRTLAEDAAEIGLPVVFHTTEENFICQGYVNLLKRALNNVINNAIHYGHRAHIFLSLVNNGVHICIEDEGPGIAEEQMHQVFTPFYRVEHSRSRKTGGTGLGLTITKEIIEKHRGTITLENRAKQPGLRVTIFLPCLSAK